MSERLLSTEDNGCSWPKKKSLLGCSSWGVRDYQTLWDTTAWQAVLTISLFYIPLFFMLPHIFWCYIPFSYITSVRHFPSLFLLLYIMSMPCVLCHISACYVSVLYVMSFFCLCHFPYVMSFSARFVTFVCKSLFYKTEDERLNKTN